MGMTRHEISRKLDEIVDFAGVERYLDTPVKRYSSGMTVRLGFAVAAFMEPEILVVDEVLAVGDAEFQKKAIGKMQDVSRGGGRTVLFVSHNMASVQRLCSKGILLENGTIKYQGTASDTVHQYLDSYTAQSRFEDIDGDPNILYLEKAYIISSGDNVIYNNNTIKIEFTINVIKNIASLVVGFNLYSQYDYPLARADYNDLDGKTTLEPGRYTLFFEIPPYTLASGNYRIVFDIAEKRIRKYTTDKSNLFFAVEQGKDGFGNAFSENSTFKTSLFREKWFKGLNKIPNE